MSWFGLFLLYVSKVGIPNYEHHDSLKNIQPVEQKILTSNHSTRSEKKNFGKHIQGPVNNKH